MAALKLSKAYKDTRPHGVVIIDLWGYKKTGYACISVFPFQAMLSATHLIFLCIRVLLLNFVYCVWLAATQMGCTV